MPAKRPATTKRFYTLTEEQRAELPEIAGMMTQAQCAAYFNMSHVTWIRLLDREPELKALYEKGRAETTRKVAHSLIKRALAGDVQAGKFYLERMAGWHETTHVQQETKKVKTFSEMYDEDDDDDGEEE